MIRTFVGKFVGAVFVGVGVALLLTAPVVLFFVCIAPRAFNLLPPPDEGKILAWMMIAVAVVVGSLSWWVGRRAMAWARADSKM